MKTDYQDDSSFSSWYPIKPAYCNTLSRSGGGHHFRLGEVLVVVFVALVLVLAVLFGPGNSSGLPLPP